MIEPTDANLLRFEARWWNNPGSKERAIRETFGLGALHYYQHLYGLVMDPQRVAVLPAELGPVVVRIRRRLDACRTQRQARAG